MVGLVHGMAARGHRREDRRTECDGACHCRWRPARDPHVVDLLTGSGDVEVQDAVALVDGQPRTLGLRELLQVFLDHRFDVVRRRTAFRRAKAAGFRRVVDKPFEDGSLLDGIHEALVASSRGRERVRKAP